MLWESENTVTKEKKLWSTHTLRTTSTLLGLRWCILSTRLGVFRCLISRHLRFFPAKDCKRDIKLLENVFTIYMYITGWPVIFKNKIPGFSRFFSWFLDDFSRCFAAFSRSFHKYTSGIFKNTSDHLAYFWLSLAYFWPSRILLTV